MFDVLTYQKGGALLRMLEQYLGPEGFRAGVSHYLKLHSHSNTETNDLWDAIEETSGEPVRRIMDSWIWQPGYPLVSASVVDGALELRQRRFRFDDDGEHGGDDDAPQRWAIPVHVRIGDDETTLPSLLPPIDLTGGAPDRVLEVAAGDLHTCARLQGGKLRCWGEGDNGRLGYGNTEDIGDDEPPAMPGDVPFE